MTDDVCPFVNRCPMFPLFRSRAALRVYKLAYCENGAKYRTCVRHQMATAGTPPHPDLLPDGTRMPAQWAKDSGDDEGQ